jgi:hypothetical protein
MKWLKKHSNIQASSLLESVLALAIISVCIYMSITFSNLFFLNKNDVTKSWEEKELNTYFYELNINPNKELPEKYKIIKTDTFNSKLLEIELEKESKIIAHKKFVINEN